MTARAAGSIIPRMDARGTHVPSSPGSPMHVDLAAVDLEMLATALSDQGWDGDWLFDPRTGETGYWQRDLGEDDEDGPGAEHLVSVEPAPSRDWYRDMVDFAEQVSDDAAARRLGRALDGKGAFRRFRDELHRGSPELLTAWKAFSDNRSDVRAVEWLHDNDLVSRQTYEAFLAEHPDPPVP